MQNQIQHKTDQLQQAAFLLGAAVRAPVFPLVLGVKVTACNSHWRIVEGPAPFPAPDAATLFPPAAEDGSYPHYYLSHYLTNLWRQVERRPSRRKEFEDNLRQIEAWLDARLIGLQRFERDLHRPHRAPQVRIKPFTRRFA